MSTIPFVSVWISCQHAGKTILTAMICFFLLLPSHNSRCGDKISFTRDIRPLLSDRCFACHGPDENDRQADLRLDTTEGEQGAYRQSDDMAAILPGQPEASAVWKRITSRDESEVMPPPDAHKPDFSAQELKRIKEWIESGAEYESFWAFQPLQRQTTPSVGDNSWSNQPIDQFVMKRLEDLGKSPSREADKRTLIRRVTFDLTGLPPTRGEIAEFLSDESESAYERLVDRLLSRQQYGEHMARYWLDLVRFADTNGMHKDFYRNFVTYRDWVITAFNDNLPYDEFVRFQLAGDLYEQPTREQLIASGYNRLHLIIDRGTALPEESFFKNVVDRVSAFGTVFMGLTIQCAQCHDHKYDPITQRDYYSLFAFFNNLDAEPETVRAPPAGLQPPFISLGSDEQHQALAALDQNLQDISKRIGSAAREKEKLEKAAKDIESQIKELRSKADTAEQSKKDSVVPSQSIERDVEPPKSQTKTDEQASVVQTSNEKAFSIPNEASSGEQGTEQDNAKGIDTLRKRLSEIQTELKQASSNHQSLEASKKKLSLERSVLDSQIPKAMVMRERDEVRKTFVMKRGEYDKPGDEVNRDTPGFLPGLKKSNPVATRMDLANWLVDAENPLTSRTAVNRIWQQFFGVGLVKTSEDLGAQGEVPSHPQLLDYLAVTFRDSGWDVKSFVKQIVMSQTYRQTSRADATEFEEDPENRLLARGSRFRLDAEMIRDQILATSGTLSLKLLGRSVKPPQPAGLWKAVTMTNEVFQPDQGEATRRRSLYTYWKRAMPPPQMTILNAPNRDACIARRERTNTPSQALLLLNEREYLRAANQLARTTLATQLDSDDNRIAFAYETVTSKLPTEEQTAVLHKLIEDLTQYYENHESLASEICFEPQPVKDSQDETTDNELSNYARLAAWTVAMNTIYNLDETKTRE